MLSIPTSILLFLPPTLSSSADDDGNRTVEFVFPASDIDDDADAAVLLCGVEVRIH